MQQICLPTAMTMTIEMTTMTTLNASAGDYNEDSSFSDADRPSRAKSGEKLSVQFMAKCCSCCDKLHVVLECCASLLLRQLVLTHTHTCAHTPLHWSASGVIKMKSSSSRSDSSEQRAPEDPTPG